NEGVIGAVNAGQVRVAGAISQGIAGEMVAEGFGSTLALGGDAAVTGGLILVGNEAQLAVESGGKAEVTSATLTLTEKGAVRITKGELALGDSTVNADAKSGIEVRGV